MAQEQEKEDKTGEEPEALGSQQVVAEGWMAKFFSFRAFITLPFIIVTYLIGVFFITIGGLVWMFNSPASAGTNVVIGVIILILGNLAWRMMCEASIVFFKMYDVLKSLSQDLTRPRWAEEQAAQGTRTKSWPETP